MMLMRGNVKVMILVNLLCFTEAFRLMVIVYRYVRGVLVHTGPAATTSSVSCFSGDPAVTG